MKVKGEKPLKEMSMVLPAPYSRFAAGSAEARAVPYILRGIHKLSVVPWHVINRIIKDLDNPLSPEKLWT